MWSPKQIDRLLLMLSDRKMATKLLMILESIHLFYLEIVEFLSAENVEACDSSSSICIEFGSGAAWCDVKSDSGAVKRVTGMTSFLLAWALIWEIENKRDWHGHWSWAFHGGKSLDTFSQTRCALKKSLTDSRGEVLIRVDVVRKQPDGYFQLRLADGKELKGSAVDSVKKGMEALGLVRMGEMNAAAEIVRDAIILCPLVFSNFRILAEIVRSDHLDRKRRVEIVSAIEEPLSELVEWLLIQKRSFDFERIPKEYHADVRQICIGKVDKDLAFVRKLVSQLRSRRVVRSLKADLNPVNVLLDYLSNPLNSKLTDKGESLSLQELLNPELIQLLDEIVDMVIHRLPWEFREVSNLSVPIDSFVEHDETTDSGRLFSERGHQNALIPKDLLSPLLVKVFENNAFRMPRARNNPTWKEQTAMQWVKLVMEH